MIHIQHHNESKNGYFIALDNDDIEAGRMTYTWAGNDKFIIDHTEVNPNFKGQGIGKKMLMFAIDFARENQFKIMPLCPFAKSVFDKSPDLNDVRF